MKGLIKRDFYLVLPTLRFFGGLAAVLLLVELLVADLAFVTNLFDFSNLYIGVFSVGTLPGLFTFDQTTNWQPYAATMPGGRRAMVDSRYSFGALVVGGVALTIALFSLIGKGGLGLTALYGGGLLLFLAVCQPLLYAFGRTVWVSTVLVAILAGLMGMGGGILALSTHGGAVIPLPVNVAALLIAAVAYLLSWRISRRVMEKKNL